MAGACQAREKLFNLNSSDRASRIVWRSTSKHTQKLSSCQAAAGVFAAGRTPDIYPKLRSLILSQRAQSQEGVLEKYFLSCDPPICVHPAEERLRKPWF
jgi:hypothetical protein